MRIEAAFPSFLEGFWKGNQGRHDMVFRDNDLGEASRFTQFHFQVFEDGRMGGWADVQGLRGEIQLDAFSTESGP